MATIRTNDFAFIFRGGLSFDVTEVAAASCDIDTKPYEAAKKAKNSTRTLTCVQTGAVEDVGPAVKSLMDLIRKKTGGKLETIGTFCAVGMSNGCALALGLATELKAAGAPYLSYVGVTNVTIMPFGRDPAIPRVGTLRPINEPNIETLNVAASFVDCNYPLAGIWPPRAKVVEGIDAKNKRNFYETQGNRLKLIKKSPLNGRSLVLWWWSNMKNGEVHGQVEGFQNQGFTVSGSSDFELHNACCTGKPFQDMLQEASDALADFPAPW